MLEQVKLRDGTNALVVALERTDKATLAAEYEKLSPETKRLRFLAPVMHLSDSLLAHLVDDVDGVNHVALVLCAETEPDVFDPVGLARIVRYNDVPDAADLAVTVKDEWHGRGVATALLEVLMVHRPVGVERIITEVFNDNPASLAMLRRLGPVHVLDTGSGVSEVDVELGPVGAPAVLGGPEGAVAVEVPAAAITGIEAGTEPGVAVDTGRGLRRHPRPARDPQRRHALRTRDSLCPWLN